MSSNGFKKTDLVHTHVKPKWKNKTLYLVNLAVRQCKHETGQEIGWTRLDLQVLFHPLGAHHHALPSEKDPFVTPRKQDIREGDHVELRGTKGFRFFGRVVVVVVEMMVLLYEVNSSHVFYVSSIDKLSSFTFIKEIFITFE